MMTRLIRTPLTAALLPLVLSGCGEEAPDRVVFREPKELYSDSTCKWLAGKDHFHDENYYTVFEAFYTKQLKEGDYATAAEALDAVANQEVYYLYFRDETRNTIESFAKHYGGHVPWTKKLFIPSYQGNYYATEGDYEKAITCFKRIIAHEPTDYATCLEIAYAYGDIGFSYLSTGEHELALKYSLKALMYFDKTDYAGGKGGVYDNIALVHLYTGNYSEAEIYFNKALETHRKSGHGDNLINTLHNKILLYQETGSPKKYYLIDSTYQLFKARDEEEESIEVALSSFYVDMLLHENRLDEAKTVLDTMAVLVAELQSENADADYAIALADYEIATGKGIQVAVIEKALAAAEGYDDFQNQIAYCELLKDDAVLKGDYRKALYWSEKEKQASNSLVNEQMMVKTLELNKRHQTKQKEQQIRLQQKTITAGRTTNALLIAILLTFLLIAAVVYLRQKQKKIRAESRRVQLYTKQLLEKTEEERKRIASDLHDSVSHELLNLKHLIGTTEQPAGTKIDAIINDIRSISRNLHPVMFEKVGLAASIEQLVERAQSVNDLMVTADVDYRSSLSVSHELQVYRIIQEALSNVIKYAEAVAARISILETKDSLQILVQDNGKGFNVSEALSGGKAFGLFNIIERSHAIGGSAKITSDKSGTTISIDIKTSR